MPTLESLPAGVPMCLAECPGSNIEPVLQHSLLDRLVPMLSSVSVLPGANQS